MTVVWVTLIINEADMGLVDMNRVSSWILTSCDVSCIGSSQENNARVVVSTGRWSGCTGTTVVPVVHMTKCPK